MSQETLYCLDSPRNSDSLSVCDNLYKAICEIGGGIFAGRSEGLVMWRSATTGVLLYCPMDVISAERVRKTTLDADSLTAVTEVQS